MRQSNKIMGTPLPRLPIEPGVLCETCWGDDGPFSEPTPLRLQLSLHDWTEGPDFIEAYRTELSTPQQLTQSTPTGCSWGAISANFGWLWEYIGNLVNVEVILRFATQPRAFINTVDDRCAVTVDNAANNALHTILNGGNASVFFGSVL